MGLDGVLCHCETPGSLRIFGARLSAKEVLKQRSAKQRYAKGRFAFAEPMHGADGIGPPAFEDLKTGFVLAVLLAFKFVAVPLVWFRAIGLQHCFEGHPRYPIGH